MRPYPSVFPINPSQICDLRKPFPSRFSIDERADVSADRGSPVLTRDVGPEYQSRYTENLQNITIEVQSPSLRLSCFLIQTMSPCQSSYAFVHMQFAG